eukprot:7095264-Prymnesium_polylepis.1
MKAVVPRRPLLVTLCDMLVLLCISLPTTAATEEGASPQNARQHAHGKVAGDSPHESRSTSAPTAVPSTLLFTNHPCGLSYGETHSPDFEAYVCSAARPYCVGFQPNVSWGSCSATAPTAGPVATSTASPAAKKPGSPPSPIAHRLSEHAKEHWPRQSVSSRLNVSSRNNAAGSSRNRTAGASP